MEKQSDIRLVIFDLDGVLVDTEWAETEALRDLALRMGAELTPQTADAMFAGRKLVECIDRIGEVAPSAPPADAESFVRRRCEQLIESSSRPLAVPGAVEAVTGTTLPSCVASNSPGPLIRRRLVQVGLADHFAGRAFSAYDIGHWKPDPELFIWAARSCGWSAEHCVVIEDSSVGVEAARAAGMRVFHYLPADRDLAAPLPGVVRLGSMTEVREAVDRLSDLGQAPAGGGVR